PALQSGDGLHRRRPVAGAGDGIAVGASPWVVELRPHRRLDIVGDGVLPHLGLGMHLHPREAEHLREKPFRQPVTADHHLSQMPAGLGQSDFTVDRHQAVGLHPPDHLGDRRTAHSEPLGDPGLDHGESCLVQFVDRGRVLAVRTSVLLGRRHTLAPSAARLEPGGRRRRWSTALGWPDARCKLICTTALVLSRLRPAKSEPRKESSVRRFAALFTLITILAACGGDTADTTVPAEPPDTTEATADTTETSAPDTTPRSSGPLTPYSGPHQRSAQPVHEALTEAPGI